MAAGRGGGGGVVQMATTMAGGRQKTIEKGRAKTS